jgi:hypothetical protein
MYVPEAIDKACGECHDTHDVSAREVLARWRDRGLDQKDVAQIVCTDCHGQHRLKSRTVRWNKRTGALIIEKPKGAGRPGGGEVEK